MTENGRKMRVLVTGSTQGIGKAIAAALVKAGHEVIVHGAEDREKAEGARREIGAAQAVVANLLQMDEVFSLHEKTGDVDILILNASVQEKEKWDAVSEASFDRQVTVNLKSTLFLLQAYVPAMKEKRFGRVVTVGSVNQYRVHPELSVYSATKCAVMSLVKNVAKDLAPFGVTVNNLSPGAIATPRNSAVYGDPEKRKKVEDAIALGRFGMPEDCVAAVMLLCSAGGSYITGTDITVDGGMLL